MQPTYPEIPIAGAAQPMAAQTLAVEPGVRQQVAQVPATGTAVRPKDVAQFFDSIMLT